MLTLRTRMLTLRTRILTFHIRFFDIYYSQKISSNIIRNRMNFQRTVLSTFNRAQKRKDLSSSTCTANFQLAVTRANQKKQRVSQENISVYKSQFSQCISKLKSVSSKLKQAFTLKIEDFQMGDIVGKGANAYVRVARHRPTGFFCAIKTLKTSVIAKELDKFIKSLKVQMFVSHPNVVKIYSIIVSAVETYIVMELCIDGDLLQNCKQFSRDESRAKIVLSGITRGLKHMHDMNIMHRDLKLENIVLCWGVPKLSDFDLSVYLRESFELRKTMCGSPAYFSPEMIKENCYDMKADIWSLGIMFFQVLSGYFPFKFRNYKDLSTIMEKQMEQLPKHLSKEARQLTLGMLSKNPELRYDLLEILHHAFFRGVDI